MRDLFNVLAKILGLFFLFTAITFLSLVFQSGGHCNPQISAFVSPLLAFLLSFILIIKTDWVSRIARVEQSTGTHIGSSGELLETGIALLGLYVFTTHLAGVVRTLAVLSANPVYRSTFDFRNSIEIVTLVVALILIFGAKRIANFIRSRQIGAS